VSPNNVTPVREADDSPPEISASPPGFPSVRVYYQGSRDEGKGLWFEYCGTLEDLVAGGAATPEMLRMNPGTGARYKRIDEDGDAYRVSRYWRSTTDDGKECAPYRYYRLRRLKPVGRLDGLPASNDAVTARLRYERWWAARRAEPGPRVQLRLVVDNTRGRPWPPLS